MVDDIGAGAERKQVRGEISPCPRLTPFYLSFPPRFPSFTCRVSRFQCPQSCLWLGLGFFFLSAYMTGMYVRVQDILFRVDSMKRFSRRLVQRFQGQPYPRLSRKG